MYLKAGDKPEIKEVKPVRDAGDKMMAVEGLREGDEIVVSAIEMEKT